MTTERLLTVLVLQGAIVVWCVVYITFTLHDLLTQEEED